MAGAGVGSDFVLRAGVLLHQGVQEKYAAITAPAKSDWTPKFHKSQLSLNYCRPNLQLLPPNKLELTGGKTAVFTF